MYSNDIFVEIIDMIYISLCRYSNNGVSIVMMNNNYVWIIALYDLYDFSQ